MNSIISQNNKVILFFNTAKDFRDWLALNHNKEAGATVGFYNVKSEKKAMTYAEAVDIAICYGWIDSVRHKIDSDSYCNRFTPRKTVNNWSLLNIKKVQELTAKGLMTDAGLKVYQPSDKSLQEYEDWLETYLTCPTS
jgi:uncharacterized protein YdeI (YjbR/CyaY-like superfamily)